MTVSKEQGHVYAGIVILVLLVLGVTLGAGCLEDPAHETLGLQNEAAIAIALRDTIVREQIPIESGKYEIVDVGPEFCMQTGPGSTFSRTCTAVTFRCSGQRSLYHVIIDDADETVVGRYWQWVKEPMPCSGGEPPVEYSTIEEASIAVKPGCPLATLPVIPAAYSFSIVRIYGEPCPRRDIVYTRGSEELRLIHVCPGHPPYAFAITGKGADEVAIRGSPGKFVQGIGQNQLAWADAHGSYWLLGDMSREDLVAVASSVEPYSRAGGTVSG